MKAGEQGKYHKWTRMEERIIQKEYNPHHWWGRNDLAKELGMTEDSLEGHIRQMKRGGRL